MHLDQYDTRILNLLKSDARMSWSKLAERIHLSASAAQRRVQAMQEAGIIRYFTLAIDNMAMGQNVRAFVQVKIARHDGQATREFIDAVLTYPQVQSCHKISGNTDFMLNVLEKDLQSFSVFLEKRILYLPGVVDATSSIVLESIKEYGNALEAHTHKTDEENRG